MQAGEAASEGLRYHHLDAVRAFALLLGVFFHAAESFGPNNYYWAVVDCSPSQLLEDIRFACHSFRLELFFVIAGFFARLLLMRRGTGGFVRNRLSRIAVPLVVGWLLLYPLLVLIWLWGASVTGRLESFGVPAEARNWSLWVLWFGFFVTGGFLKQFDLTHLWFLHQLLVLYVLQLGGLWVLARVKRRESLGLWLDAWFSRVVASRGALVWFSLATWPLLLTMASWVVDTPKSSLIPYLPTTLLFGVCFFAGWLWHRQPSLLEYPARRWKLFLCLGVLFWLSFRLLQPKVFRNLTPAQAPWARAGFELLYAHMMWAFVLGFLGFFTRFFSRPNASTRYVAEASYWIYIAHLPLVVAIQVLIGRIHLPWPVKYGFILVTVLPLLFLSYHYLVRGSFIGVQLSGRRYPLKWPWQSR